MRVTNNMILRNSSYNINGTKGSVNSSMNQMTTQKKIDKPSDDPVVAIRSLRLSTSLSRVDQYYKKNIPDAESWLDVTETALTNMKSLMTDVRTQCVNGSTDTLNQAHRNTILKQLKSLQTQLYAEGNADYAGRTVFTGYRTDQNLVFTNNETKTSYEIEQNFSYEELESFRYYTGNVKVPATKDEVLKSDISDTTQTNYYRLRTSYDKLDGMSAFSYTTKDAVGATQKVTINLENATDQTGTNVDGSNFTYKTATAVDAGGAAINPARTMYIFDTEEDWATAMGQKEVGENDIVLIKENGNIVLGEKVSSEFRTNKSTIATTYDKTGFDQGELRPEYYFNCTNKTDAKNPVSYKKYDENGKEVGYDINYTIANNQELTVNTEASDAFNSDIQRDIDDMISAVTKAINAHDKLTELKSMKSEAQYADKEYQTKLDEWMKAAQKEADYADDHLQKLFSSEIGKVDGYLGKINLSITQVGCTVDQLKLTETRMSNQQETLQELQSENDNLDLSEIIINYTAMYNAYQSSLTAAGKLSGMTLLNYL